MEGILRRERLVIAGCLAGMVLLSWYYLYNMATADMSAMDMSGMDMSGMAMPDGAAWGLAELAGLFAMWSVMMVAMMIPSAAPMILAFLSVNQQRRKASRPVVSTSIFALGYITVWTGYSAVAALAQWGLHGAALISASMALTSPGVMGAVLIAAGVYQWTPLKRRCLVGCRSPLSFLMSRWREGRWGAWRMGLEHGRYCVGCCWVLMALLFVTGVMNLAGVAVIAAFVIAEKLVPQGDWFGRATGVALGVTGVVFVGRSF